MSDRKSHTDEEIRHLEQTYDLQIVDWLTVGGEYLYEYHDQGRPKTVQENAGMLMRVPIFRRKKIAEKPKVQEGEWQKI